MPRPVPKLGTITVHMSDVSEELPVRFGPFLLLRSLGSGGMGTAYLASHPNWDGYLVVKRLHARFMNDEIVFKKHLHLVSPSLSTMWRAEAHKATSLLPVN